MATSAPPIPRIELAYAPTPLLKLERLSAELGTELWVKRDDLTGLLETGNKIRKLEFLIGEALAQRADTLITCGTLQSNCCRTVAAVSARLGMNAVLALKGVLRPNTTATCSWTECSAPRCATAPTPSGRTSTR